MAQGNVIADIAVPAYGTVYTFTNISGKRISGMQYGLPVMEPGDTVSIQANKLKPAHGSLVAEEKLSCTPTLPVDLNELARSFLWQDLAWQRMREEEVTSATKLAFNIPAGSPKINTSFTFELQVQDAAGVLVSSYEGGEVSIGVDSGVIYAVETGHFVSGTLGGVGPVRAKFSSGTVQITVRRATAGDMVVTLSSPSPVLTLPSAATITFTA